MPGPAWKTDILFAQGILNTAYKFGKPECLAAVYYETIIVWCL